MPLRVKLKLGPGSKGKDKVNGTKDKVKGSDKEKGSAKEKGSDVEINSASDSEDGSDIPDLPEGTVVVQPEPVQEKTPRFKGPEFKSANKKEGKGAAVAASSSTALDNVFCTACGRQVNPWKTGMVKKHKDLRVLICRKCYNFLDSGEIAQDEDGMDEQCRWCGEGGRLTICDECPRAYCKGCIMRNFGRASFAAVTESENWECYTCDPKQLDELKNNCRTVMAAIKADDTKKSAKSAQSTTKSTPVSSKTSSSASSSRISSKAQSELADDPSSVLSQVFSNIDFDEDNIVSVTKTLVDATTTFRRLLLNIQQSVDLDSESMIVDSIEPAPIFSFPKETNMSQRKTKCARVLKKALQTFSTSLGSAVSSKTGSSSSKSSAFSKCLTSLAATKCNGEVKNFESPKSSSSKLQTSSASTSIISSKNADKNSGKSSSRDSPSPHGAKPSSSKTDDGQKSGDKKGKDANKGEEGLKKKGISDPKEADPKKNVKIGEKKDKKSDDSGKNGEEEKDNHVEKTTPSKAKQKGSKSPEKNFISDDDDDDNDDNINLLIERAMTEEAGPDVDTLEEEMEVDSDQEFVTTAKKFSHKGKVAESSDLEKTSLSAAKKSSDSSKAAKSSDLDQESKSSGKKSSDKGKASKSADQKCVSPSKKSSDKSKATKSSDSDQESVSPKKSSDKGKGSKSVDQKSVSPKKSSDKNKAAKSTDSDQETVSPSKKSSDKDKAAKSTDSDQESDQESVSSAKKSSNKGKADSSAKSSDKRKAAKSTDSDQESVSSAKKSSNKGKTASSAKSSDKGKAAKSTESDPESDLETVSAKKSSDKGKTASSAKSSDKGKAAKSTESDPESDLESVSSAKKSSNKGKTASSAKSSDKGKAAKSPESDLESVSSAKKSSDKGKTASSAKSSDKGKAAKSTESDPESDLESVSSAKKSSDKGKTASSAKSSDKGKTAKSTDADKELDQECVSSTKKSSDKDTAASSAKSSGKGKTATPSSAKDLAGKDAAAKDLGDMDLEETVKNMARTASQLSEDPSQQEENLFAKLELIQEMAEEFCKESEAKTEEEKKTGNVEKDDAGSDGDGDSLPEVSFGVAFLDSDDNPSEKETQKKTENKSDSRVNDFSDISDADSANDSESNVENTKKKKDSQENESGAEGKKKKDAGTTADKKGADKAGDKVTDKTGGKKDADKATGKKADAKLKKKGGADTADSPENSSPGSEDVSSSDLIMSSGEDAEERREKVKRRRRRKKNGTSNGKDDEDDSDKESDGKTRRRVKTTPKKDSKSKKNKNDSEEEEDSDSVSKKKDKKKRKPSNSGDSEDKANKKKSRGAAQKKEQNGSGDKKKKEKSKKDLDSSEEDELLEKEIDNLLKGSRKSKKKKEEESDDDQEDEEDSAPEKKIKEEKKDKKTKRGKKAEKDVSSDSSDDEKDEEDDEEPDDDDSMDEGVTKSKKSKIQDEDLEKMVAKAAMMSEQDDDANDDDEDQNDEDEDSSSDSDVEKEDKKTKAKKNGKAKASKSEDKDEEDEDEDDSDMQSAGARKRFRSKLLDAKISDSDSDIEVKKRKIGKKRKRNSDDESFSEAKDSDDDNEDDEDEDGDSVVDSDESNSDSDAMSDESGAGKKKGKGKKGGKGNKGKKGGKDQKKRKRIKRMNSSSEPEPGSRSQEDGGEDGEEPGSRKKIRKIKSDKKLGDTTKAAARAEEDRRNRVENRQKKFNGIVQKDTGDGNAPVTTKLVLEHDDEKDKDLIQVNTKLVCKLKPHQVEAVKFMWDCMFESLERSKKAEKSAGCILAHCMGLGKTLSVVTFVHTMMSHAKLTKMKTCLVVSPLNTVLNWQNEFDIWLEEKDKLEVYEMASIKQNHARADCLKEWHRDGGIMIIGYEMLRNLCLGSRCRNKKQKAIFQETLIDPGPDLVVCDEGHIMKNAASALSKAMNTIKTRRRVVLTGTPLQNNLIEYHCMVDFVKPNLLGTKKEFANRFVNPIINGQHKDSTGRDVRVMKNRAHVLHELLAGCVQRRDYSALTKFLPPKQEYVISVRLSEKQVKLYEEYMRRNGQVEGQITTRGAQLFKDYQNLMKIWTHPWVMKLAEIRDDLKMKYDDEDSFLDDEYSDDSDKELASEPSSSSSEEESPVKAKVKSEDDESAGEGTSSGRRSRRLRAKDKKSAEDKDEIVNNWKTRSRGGEDVTMDVDAGPQPVSSDWWAEYVKEEDQDNLELGGKLVLLFDILRMCEEIGDKVLIFSQSLLSLNIIEYFLEHIDNKFTQDTQDKPDEELKEEFGKRWTKGDDYFRLDGSTSAQMRQHWAGIFNSPENHRARLFLISTRAGGLGINLVGANRVIIFDASWNPSHDVQSIFRVYRFGQKKPCYIYRFLAQGTMEEKIYDRQVAKLSLSQRVVDEHQVERHFNASDLAELYLFKPELLSDDKEKATIMLPKDVLLAEIVAGENKDWFVAVHEHDSLLENLIEQELTEEEKKAAWDEYENEKKGLRVNVSGQGGAGLGNYLSQEFLLQTARNLRMQHPDMPQEVLQMHLQRIIMMQIRQKQEEQRRLELMERQQASQFMQMQQRYAALQQQYLQQMGQAGASASASSQAAASQAAQAALYPNMMPGQRFSPSLYAHMAQPGVSVFHGGVDNAAAAALAKDKALGNSKGPEIIELDESNDGD